MKATKATVRARVDDVLRIRLDGAEFWDIRQYVAEKERAGEQPWAIPEGGKPIGQRQLWRYVGRADRLMAVSSETCRQKRLRVHLARRKSLYARAVAAGDVRAALAVLQDLAKMQGLYPSEDDALRRDAEALRKQLTERKGARHGGGDGNAAQGAGGPGERGEGAPEPPP
jgi:hypothetical protein